jgi:hypothetical protein
VRSLNSSAQSPRRRSRISRELRRPSQGSRGGLRLGENSVVPPGLESFFPLLPRAALGLHSCAATAAQDGPGKQAPGAEAVTSLCAEVKLSVGVVVR